MTIFSIVVAMAENQVIGYQNQLPWHLPADLRHFKQLTMGKPILMGRKTFASIGHPLPGRRNLVLTRQADLQLEGCEIIHQADKLKMLNLQAEVMVIGGAEIYQQFLPQAQTLHITWVHKEFIGDTQFPKVNWQEWQSQGKQSFQADERNACNYSFETFIRHCSF